MSVNLNLSEKESGRYWKEAKKTQDTKSVGEFKDIVVKLKQNQVSSAPSTLT
jgi:hypothetical protein